ncbi:FecR domain-containing protein [bacterium]|nr:FecR domain-containing protein [bacterium]MBU1613999.1 FecR domain-containing protein [bacterium]
MVNRLSFFLTVFLLTIMASHFHPVGASEVARVTLVSGEPIIKRALSADWELVETDMLLYPQDEIKTDEDSFLEIQYEDGGILRLDSETELSIEGGEKKQILNLWTGKIYNRIRRLYSKESSYEIKTPAGVAGVRGTEFKVEHRHQQTRVAVLDGVVEIENEKGRAILSKDEESFLTEEEKPGLPIRFDLAKELRWERWADPLIYGKIGVLRDRVGEHLDKIESYLKQRQELYEEAKGLIQEEKRIEESLQEIERNIHGKSYEELKDETGSLIETEGKIRTEIIGLKVRVRNFSKREQRLILLKDEIRSARPEIQNGLRLLFKARSFDPNWSKYQSSYEEMLSKIKELKEEYPLKEMSKELDFGLKELGEKRRYLTLRLWRLRERAKGLVEKEKGVEKMEALLLKEEEFFKKQGQLREDILGLFSPKDIDSLEVNIAGLKSKYAQAEKLAGEGESLISKMEEALRKAELRADKTIRYRGEIDLLVGRLENFKDEIEEVKERLEELERLTSELLKIRGLIPELVKDYEQGLKDLSSDLNKLNSGKVKVELFKIKAAKKKGLLSSELREKNNYLDRKGFEVRFLWKRAKEVFLEKRELLKLLNEGQERTSKINGLIGQASGVEKDWTGFKQKIKEKISALKIKEAGLKKTIIELKSKIKNVREEV